MLTAQGDPDRPLWHNSLMLRRRPWGWPARPPRLHRGRRHPVRHAPIPTPRQPARRLPGPQRRLRLPAVQPPSLAHGGRERRRAAPCGAAAAEAGHRMGCGRASGSGAALRRHARPQPVCRSAARRPDRRGREVAAGREARSRARDFSETSRGSLRQTPAARRGADLGSPPVAADPSARSDRGRANRPAVPRRPPR
jgi:hypothetical protein